MSLFSQTFQSLVDPGAVLRKWPTVLLSNDPVDMHRQIELATRWMKPPVAHQVLEWLASDVPGTFLHGIAAFMGCAVAGLDGWTATELVSERLVKVENTDGQAALLTPLAFDSMMGLSEEVDEFRRLKRQVAAVLADYQYVVHLRRELPSDFDPLKLVQPLETWIQERLRSDSVGDYAVYDDGEIGLELCILGPRPEEDSAGLLFHVPPLVCEDLLRLVIPRLSEAAAHHRQLKTGLPLVAVVLGNGPWMWTPSLLLNVLYGKRSEVHVTEQGPQRVVEHRFETGPWNLFGSGACDELASIWWLEPGTDVNRIVQGVSHENPWRSVEGQCPDFVGTGYRGVGEEPTSDDSQKKVARMVRSGSSPEGVDVPCIHTERARTSR